MKKLLQSLALLGVNSVPALGWFVEGWSAGTMLVIYGSENVAACLLVSLRIALHGRGTPRRGNVLLFRAFDFLVDLRGLRGRPFLWIEPVADRNLARAVMVHLTIVFGMLGVALTGATRAFFGVFVALKTLNDLSAVLPQWNPATPPRWMCGAMERLPNAHPGQTFAEFWARDQEEEERARREGNEQPWKG